MKTIAKITCIAAMQIAFAQTTGLKDIYANYFRFGSILNYSTVNNSTMQELIFKDFNSITPENELKPDATLVKDGSSFKVALNQGAKDILKFCQDYKIPMRGHTLVWHSQTPNWFFRENFSDNGNVVTPEVMDQRMEKYIKDMFELIATSYPDLNLYAYDVVNEAAKTSDKGPRDPCNESGNGSCGENSMWVKVYGNNSFIRKAFTYARQYAPATTKLYYNDFNEYQGAKRDYIADEIVKPLFDEGLLDGMGMQSHLDVRDGNNAWPSASEYGQAVKKYKDIGVDIQVTELDATINNGDRTKFEAQAKYLRDVMSNIISNGGDKVKAVIVWGIRDDQSWRKERTPLLYEGTGNNLVKKAAYDSLVALIPEDEWGDGSTGGDWNNGEEGGCNLVRNGDFKNTMNWDLNTWDGSEAAFNVSGGEASIAIAKLPDDGKIWNLQLVQSGINLVKGKTYRLAFDASAASAREIGLVLQMPDEPWDTYWNNDEQNIRLTAAKQSFSYTFTMDSATDENSRIGFNVGNATPTVKISNVMLADADEECDIASIFASRPALSNFSLQALSGKRLLISANSPALVEIYDLKGKKAASFNVSGSQTVNLSLPSGMYFAKAQGRQSVKFMLK